MRKVIFHARNNLRTGLAIIIVLLMAGNSLMAMPPHPRLLEEQNAGKRSLPAFMLKSPAELAEVGLNSPSTVFSTRKAGVSGDIKTLAVLIEFSDNANTASAASFDTFIFGTSQGNVRHYYQTISFDGIDIVPVNLPSSLDWVTAPQTYAYYADGEGGTGLYPHNTQKLCEDIVDLIDGSVNFANYDGDGDGYVDCLILVHAGTGGEYSGDPNDIWSHKWGISPRVKDGKSIYEYAVVPELWAAAGDITCGVYCHEMGHIFGLPDLYDTDGSSYGIGTWSLMSSGSWLGPTYMGECPAALDAWCRVEVGFNSYTNVSSNQSDVNIEAVINGGPIYRLWSSGGASSEYYLVENRYKTGYDAYLPGQGLLIWHIDDSRSDNEDEWYPGHTSSGHYLVALEQADNNFSLEQKTSQGDGADPFPGTGAHTSFSPLTSPNTNAYNGDNTYIAVSSISTAGLTMTADFQVSLVSDIPEDDENLPIQFALGQNYPNPFNPVTTISINLSEATDISLSVFNTLGQKIAIIADGIYPAGENIVTWEGLDSRGKALPSGVYFYELLTDSGSESKKMLMLK